MSSLSRDRLVDVTALSAVGLLAALIALMDAPPASRAALLLVSLVAAVLVLARHRLAAGDWFHPTVFPLMYVCVVLTAPTVYLVVANRPLEALPSELTPSVAVVFALTILGLATGLLLGFRTPPPGTNRARPGMDLEKVRKAGRAFLLAATVPRLYSVIQSAGEQYGTGTVDFGLEQTALNLAVFLFFAGTILIITANAQLVGRIATRTDLALFVPFVVLTLVSGGRDEFLAPLLFGVWAQHTLVKRISPARVALAILVIALVFQAVGGSRVGGEALPGPGAAIERTMVAIGTPTNDVGEIVRRVPAAHGYELGSTYLAGLERQLPSPIANRLFGTPDDTGAYVFRKILGFEDPNVGFGFSLPSEGYLNFGFIGSFASALIFGGLLGFAFQRQATPPRRALHLLYPILMSTLPLAIRSDALGQIKWILYPLLMVATVLALSRSTTAAATVGTRRGYHLPTKGSSARIAGTIAALAVCLPALALVAAAHQRGFHAGGPARAAIAEVTGIPLQVTPPSSTGAVNVLATYVGGTADESVILIVCATGSDAAEISAAPASDTRGIRVARNHNLVVIYQRDRAVGMRWSAIRAALRRGSNDS